MVAATHILASCVLAVLLFYLVFAVIWWRYARHFEERMRLPGLTDVSLAWSFFDCTRSPRLAKCALLLLFLLTVRVLHWGIASYS